MWLIETPWCGTMAGLSHIGMASLDMMQCLARTCPSPFFGEPFNVIYERTAR